ncbi:right-handed parallel beta-helix repeat-containing protein [bacterium]|nr:right-handed parallel beta-helix repeat-containing protein [candidate division CSSED10-310 bacterium]
MASCVLRDGEVVIENNCVYDNEQENIFLKTSKGTVIRGNTIVHSYMHGLCWHFWDQPPDHENDVCFNNIICRNELSGIHLYEPLTPEFTPSTSPTAIPRPPDLSYNCLSGNPVDFSGRQDATCVCCVNADPLCTDYQSFFLRQDLVPPATATARSRGATNVTCTPTSPCVNAGHPSCTPFGSTRRNYQPDVGIADIGYHYPRHSCHRLKLRECMQPSQTVTLPRNQITERGRNSPAYD